MTIREIFTHRGELAFRLLEKKYLTEITTTSQNSIISLGGGTPCFNELIQLIKEKGISIYLKAEPKLLADRIMYSHTVRPMFENLPKTEVILKLESLLLERGIYYEQANLILPAVNINVNEVLELINQI